MAEEKGLPSFFAAASLRGFVPATGNAIWEMRVGNDIVGVSSDPGALRTLITEHFGNKGLRPGPEREAAIDRTVAATVQGITERIFQAVPGGRATVDGVDAFSATHYRDSKGDKHKVEAVIWFEGKWWFSCWKFRGRFEEVSQCQSVRAADFERILAAKPGDERR